jgi:hypothetical protein
MQKYLKKGHTIYGLTIGIPVLSYIIGYMKMEPMHVVQLEGTGKE